MLIILAWMSLRASMTLTGLLTLILFPVAVLRLRRSAPFAAMTLAMLGMMWRGETWKYGCLTAEQLGLQSQPLSRQQPQFLPNKAHLSQSQVIPCAVLGSVWPSAL